MTTNPPDNVSPNDAATVTSGLTNSNTINTNPQGPGSEGNDSTRASATGGNGVRSRRGFRPAPTPVDMKELTVGALQMIEERPHWDQFLAFQQDLINQIKKKFKHARDVVGLVQDIEDQEKVLLMSIPKSSEIDEQVKKLGIDENTKEGKAEADEVRSLLKIVFTDQLETFVKQRLTLQEIYIKIYSITWGNCLLALQSEITSTNKEYKERSKNNDAVWLLEQVQLLTSGLNNKRNSAHNAYSAIKNLYTLRQQFNEPLKDYYRRFRASIDTAELQKVSAFLHECMIKAMQKEEKYQSKSKEEIEKAAIEKYKAVLFITNANVKRYRLL